MQTQINDMLAKMPPKDRRMYAGILQGKVTHNVYCNQGGKSQQAGLDHLKHNKGALIASIYHDDTVRGIRDDNGAMWLKASRVRTDGSSGFECWCGNDSRRTKDEMGVFDDKGNHPEQSELVELFKKVGGKGAAVKDITEKQEVDGFTIEAV